MRPIKLTMTAFGPYRDSETIDFSVLGDRRLFVIAGSTGAGKTSIFDAICYALYDAASGEDRAESRLLRSHYASEDTHTSVDFTFAVGKRVFRVFRQMKHRKGTNKNETGDKIEFYEVIDGEEVPAVDRFILSEVNAKITAILGLTKEQFSQIVMLPQGEFRKLLTSDTDNKEEILRHIFRTGLYERLEARFHQMSRELRDRCRDAKSDLTLRIKHVQETLPLRPDSLLASVFEQPTCNALQVLEGLADERDYYTEKVAIGNQQHADASAELEAQEQALRAAIVQKGQFDALAARREQLAQLELERPVMEQRSKLLAMADRAVRIEPYEAHAAQYQQEFERKTEVLSRIEQDYDVLRHELELAEKKLMEEEARQREGKQLEQELSKLEQWVPAVQQLDKLQAEMARLGAEDERLSSALTSLENQQADNRSKRQELTISIKEKEAQAKQYPRQVSELEKVQRTIRLLQDLAELEERVTEQSRLEHERKQQWQKAKAEHDRLEQLWLEGQAGWLAAHLHDGSPCPVCGSDTHPNKAQASAEMPSREVLQQAKDQLRQLEAEFQEAKTQAAASRSAKALRAADLSEAADDDESELPARITAAKELEAQLMQETKRLKQAHDELPQLQEQLDTLERAYEESEKQKRELMAHKQELAGQIGRIQSLLEKDLERIPEQLRDPAALSHAITQLMEQLQAITKAYELAQEQLQQLRVQEAAESAKRLQVQQQIEELSQKLDDAKGRLHAELAQADFPSFEAYKAAQLPLSTREAYQQEIDRYTQTMQTIKTQISELEKELEGIEPADLEALKQAVSALKAHRDQIQVELHQAAEYLAKTMRLSEALHEADHKVKVEEQQLGQVEDLYFAMKGDNPLKISFERYILIEYLEQILHAANERLYKLSSGQFRLERSDRLESRGKQSGLGLDVYDAYTGQRRDVKSLSGGEKFNASLSLALGMTDVIQAYQGGVSIEMMFIDEGFGSLDEEALNKAIHALVDVQQTGRMIGVISHVQELKQAFPAVLEVIKTKEGISKTKMILKS